MNLVSGRLNTLSIGKEATFKTPVATTALVPNSKQSGKLEYKYVDSEILTGSRASAPSIIVGQEGKLTVPFQVNLETVGHLLAGSLSDAKTGSGPYTHTFTSGSSTTPQSWTFLDGRGAYEYYQIFGAVQNSLSFDVAADAIISGSAEYVYIGENDMAIAVIPANVTIASGLFTVTNTFTADTPVKLFPKVGTDVLPTGLVVGQTYYVNSPTGTTFKLAATVGGPAIASYVSAGTGNFELYVQEILDPPSNRLLAFKDSASASAVKVNATNFGDLRSFSVALNNKLDSSEKVLGGGGNINSIVTPQIEVTGKITVNFKAETAFMRTAYGTGATVSLQLDFNEDASNYLRFYFPAVQLKGGDMSYEDGGITQSFDIMGSGSLAVSPITVTLVNGHSAAY